MPLWKRILIAASVLLVDVFAFALPLAALATGYVLLARPPWFLHWVVRLYDIGERGGAPSADAE